MSAPMPAPEAAASAPPSTSASTVGSTTPDDRASAFRAADAGAESVSGGALLVGAYAVILVVLVLVVMRVFLRQNGVAKRIESLEANVREARAKGDSK